MVEPSRRNHAPKNWSVTSSSRHRSALPSAKAKDKAVGTLINYISDARRCRCHGRCFNGPRRECHRRRNATDVLSTTGRSPPVTHVTDCWRTDGSWLRTGRRRAILEYTAPVNCPADPRRRQTSRGPITYVSPWQTFNFDLKGADSTALTSSIPSLPRFCFGWSNKNFRIFNSYAVLVLTHKFSWVLPFETNFDRLKISVSLCAFRCVQDDSLRSIDSVAEINERTGKNW
jgi:hypothetical protein